MIQTVKITNDGYRVRKQIKSFKALVDNKEYDINYHNYANAKKDEVYLSVIENKNNNYYLSANYPLINKMIYPQDMMEDLLLSTFLQVNDKYYIDYSGKKYNNAKKASGNVLSYLVSTFQNYYHMRIKDNKYPLSFFSHLCEIAQYHHDSNKDINMGISLYLVHGFLMTWYHIHNLRIVYNYGMFKSQIKDMKIPTLEIYHYLTHNPFVVFSMEHSKAKAILEMGGLFTDLPEYAAEMGLFTREIYNRFKKGYMCVRKESLSTYSYLVQQIKLNDYLIKEDKDYYYLEHSYNMEQHIIKFITNLQESDVYGYPPVENGQLLYDKLSTSTVITGEKLFKYLVYIDGNNKNLTSYEYKPLIFKSKKQNQKLSLDQEIAVQGAINNHFSVITGPAGTGKSKCIFNIVESLYGDVGVSKRRILVGTPTGIAASRLRKCLCKTNINVATLHSLIGYRNKKVYDYKLQQQQERKLIEYYDSNFDYLIIDEAGMVSYELFYTVLLKYPEIKYITLVGDYNQLQPIKSASLFREIILSNTVPVYKLVNNHRTKVKSPDGKILDNYILYNATNILKNVNFQLYDNQNFQIINNGTIEEICNISAYLRDDGIHCEDVTVITPYKAPLVQFNGILRELWNGENMKNIPVLDTWNKPWYIGDRVRMTVNNREHGIYNGDEGIVTQWVNKAGKICGIYVKFFCQNEKDMPLEFLFKAIDPKLGIHDIEKANSDETEKTVIEDETDDDYNNEMVTYHLTLSYALTIHSAQGAEYPYVIFYLPPTSSASNTFFNNSMLYTIITRGKEFCFCVGNISEMNNSIRCIDKRNLTHTKELLQELLPNLQGITLESIDQSEICEYVSTLDDDEEYENVNIDYNCYNDDLD